MQAVPTRNPEIVNQEAMEDTEQEQTEFRTLREDLGLTQAEMADLLGVSLRTVCRYDTGVTTPKAVIIKFLKQKL